MGKGGNRMPAISLGSLQHYALSIVARLRHFFHMVSIRHRERSLRVCETVSLGDKRFVAVVQFERRRFLLGVTPHSVSLLQGLGEQDLPPADDRPATAQGSVL